MQEVGEIDAILIFQLNREFSLSRLKADEQGHLWICALVSSAVICMCQITIGLHCNCQLAARGYQSRLAILITYGLCDLGRMYDAS